MTQVFTIMMVVLLPIAAAAVEWWWMRNRFLTRLREVKARHQRDRRRSDEALAAAKRQIATLQHQLTGARLKAQRAERTGGATSFDRKRAVGSHGPLLMMDGDLPSSTLNGFADTTVVSH